MKTLKTNIPIISTPSEFIANASDVFSYIDPDFKEWKTDMVDTPNSAVAYSIFELTEDATFAQIFTTPETMYLSQKQIIDFCRNHKAELRKDGNGTLFLFKVGTEFFVASVHVYSGGLYVNVFRLGNDYVWFADDRHRFVLPQLTLTSLDSDTLVINGVTYKKI